MLIRQLRNGKLNLPLPFSSYCAIRITLCISWRDLWDRLGLLYLVIFLQQVSSSTAWDATPSNGLSRTNSVPDNFGSSTNGAAVQQAAALPTTFTVTTGDVLMRTVSGEGPAAAEAVVSRLVHFVSSSTEWVVHFILKEDLTPSLEDVARSVMCIHACICRKQGALLSGSCQPPLLRLIEAWMQIPMPPP